MESVLWMLKSLKKKFRDSILPLDPSHSLDSKEVNKLDDTKIKETLERQLRLLSERSAEAEGKVLAELSEAMVDIAKLLIY